MRKICESCGDRISSRVKYIVTVRCKDGEIRFNVGDCYEDRKFKVMVMEEVFDEPECLCLEVHPDYCPRHAA